jgi:hypothetical protein
MSTRVYGLEVCEVKLPRKALNTLIQDYLVDVEARRARLQVPGMIEATGQPILNPVTGAEHRVRIDFPNSFEFAQAEIGSGTSKTTGPVALDLHDTYGQFAHIHLSHKGRLN